MKDQSVLTERWELPLRYYDCRLGRPRKTKIPQQDCLRKSAMEGRFVLTERWGICVILSLPKRQSGWRIIASSMCQRTAENVKKLTASSGCCTRVNWSWKTNQSWSERWRCCKRSVLSQIGRKLNSQLGKNAHEHSSRKNGIVRFWMSAIVLNWAWHGRDKGRRDCRMSRKFCTNSAFD
jgi:hypothetical protein